MILLPDNPSIHSVSQFNLMVRLSGSAPMRVRDALFVTDQLVRHGCYDLASRVIDRLAGAGHRNETLNVRLDGLAMAAERVRDVLGLDAMLADSSKIERLLSFNSCIFGSMTTTKRLAIVYSTAWNNFDVSFPFLHCLIASHADCIIYVKNPERGMYATGNYEYGKSIDQVSANLCNLISGMKPSRVTVLGFSGGGYAALHLAAKAKADEFLGLGVRTDFSTNSVLTKVNGRTAPQKSDYANNTLINMKEMPEITDIQRAVLYFGTLDLSDQEHALNMSGLPNFTIVAVSEGSHNLVMDFLLRGQLQEVLTNVLD